MTYGHEPKVGDSQREWGYQVEGAKGKNWDKCDGIINHIYFLKILKRYSQFKSFKYSPIISNVHCYHYLGGESFFIVDTVRDVLHPPTFAYLQVLTTFYSDSYNR